MAERAMSGGATVAGRRREPRRPTQLHPKQWWGTLRRTAAQFRADNLTDWAAALTYYSVLSLFPALLVLVSVLGLFGAGTIDPLIHNVSKFAPGQATQIITTALGNLRHTQAAAGALAIVGVLAALWSASGYVAAFMRASNAVYDVREGRPLWKKLPVRLGVTVALVVLLAASALLIVFSGGIAERAGRALGLGSTGLTVWGIAKWPVLLLIVIVIFAILYWAAPNARTGGFRWITPGGTLGVLIWIAASVGFAFYVSHFGSYNKTYGALAGVVIFLVWLWVSNLAVLFGAEFDAELYRSRRIAGGMAPDTEPYMEMRDTTAIHDEKDKGSHRA